MKHLKYYVLILALAFLAAGCGKKQSDKPQMEEKSEKKQAKNTANNKTAGHMAKLAGTRIDLQNAKNLKPGNVTLSFRLYGADARELGSDNLKTEREKPLHLLLVRDDITEYQHLHPEYQNGYWTVNAQIPQNGNYNLYADIAPVKEDAAVLRVPVAIGEPAKIKNFPKVSAGLSVASGEVIASLDNAELSAGKAIPLAFKLAKNGKSVNEIESYLGAYGHVVAFSHSNPDHFVRVHPANSEKPTGGSVKMEAEFPEDGMYTIFAQFKIAGGVKTFPITAVVGKDAGFIEHEGGSAQEEKEMH